MSTDKDIAKMQVAKALMAEGHSEVARAVLEVTSHPKASEWLAKLPKEKGAVSSSRRSPLFLGGMIALVLLVGALSFVAGRATAPTSLTLSELIAATPGPEMMATFQATSDAIILTSESLSTVIALTSMAAPPTPTRFGG